jgi:hypothetical protein
MDVLNIPVLLLIALCIAALRLIIHFGELQVKGDGLPPPDLRRCERRGSAEYFIRASRGTTRD